MNTTLIERVIPPYDWWGLLSENVFSAVESSELYQVDFWLSLVLLHDTSFFG